MFLLEHHAKTLLAECGIPVPEGIFVDAPVAGAGMADDGAGWVVKAQILAGGRGKQGGIRLAPGWDDVARETAAMLGRTIGGHAVRAVRIERRVAWVSEAYLSLSVAPAERQIRVILSGVGGVEIEALHHAGGTVRSALASPTVDAVTAAIGRLAESVGGPVGAALAAAGARLAPVFFARDLVLLEINPLFVRADGSWCAGDAKITVDDNAAGRQDFLGKLLAENPERYPDQARKAAHDFDYLVIDPGGEIGLLTTGAGLSMMLIDELRAAGLRPYNFLDVRSGGLHGDPQRLIQVLSWIAEGPAVRVVFCNIFAGSTDLGAFAKLLLTAAEQVPTVPMVIRLVGNRADAARAVLEAAGRSMTSDLDAAVAELRQVLEATR